MGARRSGADCGGAALLRLLPFTPLLLALAQPVQAATKVYYSAGTSTANLKPSGAVKVTIASGTATFDTPLANNIGLGDAVRYDTTSKAYISGRTSSTVYSVTTATGGTPPDVTNATVNEISRAFNTLTAAEAGSPDASHLNTSDLVSADYQLNWVAYNDTPMNDRPDIDGWTTGPTNYIRIFTPVTSTEVGSSQRHTGTAGTGFVLRHTQSSPSTFYSLFIIREEYVRVEGIEVDGTNVTNGEHVRGMHTYNGAGMGSTDIRIDKCIVHDLRTGANAVASFATAFYQQSGNLIKISNSVFYAIENLSTNANSQPTAIALEVSASTAYVYNNTVFNVRNSGSTNVARGINADPAVGTVVAKNNYVGRTISDGGPEYDFLLQATTIVAAYNVSSDATADDNGGAGNVVNRSSYGSYFHDIGAGSEDLHLRSDSKALWGTYGADLSGDPNLPVTDDIDGHLRDPVWPDIGADEGPNRVYYSIGKSYPTDIKSGAPTLNLAAGMATLSEAQPNNVGVGDEITYDGSNKVYISGRTSSTVYSVTTATGVTPPDITGATVNSIKRTFGSLAAAQAGSSDASHLATTDLAAGSYQLNWPCYGDDLDSNTAEVIIGGWTTGRYNYIRIYTPVHSAEVGASQRHDGKWNTTSAYRIEKSTDSGAVIVLNASHVHIDGLQIRHAAAVADEGVWYRGSGEFWFSESIVRNGYEGAIRLQDAVGATIRIWNNLVYDASGHGIHYTGGAKTNTIIVYNNTIVDAGTWGLNLNAASAVYVKNNLVQGSGMGDYFFNNNTIETTFNNVSQDNTSPDIPYRNLTAIFVNQAGDDFHLDPTDTAAKNQGIDLSSDSNLSFWNDVDGQTRLGQTWDIGADEQGAPTAVRLERFIATGWDAEVIVEWRTASEVDNLGFHVYRAISAVGPWTRITSIAIPGLGSSPEGAQYSYRDSGLANGVTYYYMLEDIETTGKTERHGPVSATPMRGSLAGPNPSSNDGPAASTRITYGDPLSTGLRILEKSERHVLLELRTGGFYAVPQPDGTVRLSIPGFSNEAEPGLPAIPVWRSWIEVPASRQARVASVEAEDVEVLSTLRPGAAEAYDVISTRRGAVELHSRTARRPARLPRAGLYPKEAARLVSEGYQGELKKALLELASLRWDGRRLFLAKRLTVRLALAPTRGAQRDPGRARSSERGQTVLRRLVVREKGLYGIRFEEVMGPRRVPLAESSLRLSRLGESVPFHIEPASGEFGPGSTLYFLSEGASLNPYETRAVYELGQGDGVRMPVESAPGFGPVVGWYWHQVDKEENRYYQAGLLEAADRWFWDLIFAPARKLYWFGVTGLASAPETGRLEIALQGVSDLPESPDHHVRIYLNGTLLVESSWNGKKAKALTAEIPPGALREGENGLEIENVGDTGALYSMVMLDRYRVFYPRLVSVEENQIEGRFSESGMAEITRLGEGALVLDVSESLPRWLTAGSDFRVEAGRSYIAVGLRAVRKPEVENALASRLKSALNRADYLVIAPKAFLEAAQPLLDLRRRQGLRSRAVVVEEVYSEFGYGEARPEALRDFLSYAYHHWRRPAPRYVLLLGDGSYDFKNVLGTGVRNWVPPLIVKTSYLWTASDPAYASVNGDDGLPDLAIGRLPAASVEEARALVEKILAYESRAPSSEGHAVLVADNPDSAGDFVASAEEIANGPLAGMSLRRIYLSELGPAGTRSAIEDAFNQGASMMSYFGHGGIHLWANENIFDIGQVGSLLEQPQQPLLFTLNCLNGYFHFPYFNALAEELLKAEEKGVIAAFSPSGLSLNGPARRYHHALLNELLRGGHARLGDALLAAQADYASVGDFTDLLRIYHLFGDPALTLPLR